MKKRVFIFFIALMGILSLVMSCSPYATTAMVMTPKGSVLQQHVNQTNNSITEDGKAYVKTEIVARVTNVGENGNFFVNVRITPYDDVWEPIPNPQKTEVYLERGDEKEVTFIFWVKGWTYSYRIWCSNF